MKPRVRLKGFFLLLVTLCVLGFQNCSPKLTSLGGQAAISSGRVLTDSSAGSAPTIFFTDLQSGPSVGGESNNGAIVTLYGKRFGSSQGSSTVTIGSGVAASYLYWSDTKIAVAIGSAATTGSMVVHTSVGNSNAISFTVRPGSIYCVAVGGSDSNTGQFPSSCWKDIDFAVTQVKAGDTIYVKNGVTLLPGDGGYADTLTLGIPGTATSPIGLIAYPGASVTIGTIDGDERGIYACSGLSLCSDGRYWVIAGMTVRSVCEPMEMLDDGLRLVANDISDPNCVDGQSGSISIGGSYISILGNNIHDTAANTLSKVTKLHHAIYIGDGSHAVDVGWNVISNNHGNRGIQVYTSTPGGDGDIYDIHVHDNLIYNNRGDGILFNEVNSDKGTIEAYNNIVYKAGLGPDFPDGGTGWDCLLASSIGNTPIQIYNNTFYTCGYSGGGQPAGGIFTGDAGPVSIKNNIAYQHNSFGYFDGGGLIGNCSNNLWFGAGSPPAGCMNNVVSDPLFADLANFDFHLQSGSPAVDTGINISNLLTDFDGVPRPQGLGYDIGAYEYASGSGVLPTPTSTPTSSATPTPNPTASPTPKPTASPTPNPSVTPIDNQPPTTAIISPVSGAVVPAQS